MFAFVFFLLFLRPLFNLLPFFFIIVIIIILKCLMTAACRFHFLPRSLSLSIYALVSLVAKNTAQKPSKWNGSTVWLIIDTMAKTPRAVINLSIFIHQININWMWVHFNWNRIYTGSHTAFNCILKKGKEEKTKTNTLRQKKEHREAIKCERKKTQIVYNSQTDQSVCVCVCAFERKREKAAREPCEERVWDGDSNKYIMCKNHVCKIRFMRTVNRNTKVI